MKKIKSFQDVSLIIRQKLDIKDDMGKDISFVSFLRMKLIDVLAIIDNGEWTYDDGTVGELWRNPS